MVLKNKKLKRFSFLLAGFLSIALATFFVLKALDEKIVFFYTPSKLFEKEEDKMQYIRVGGLVKEKSINFRRRSRLSFGAPNAARSIGLRKPHKIHGFLSISLRKPRKIRSFLSNRLRKPYKIHGFLSIGALKT